MWHSNRYFERKIAHAHRRMLAYLGAAACIVIANRGTDAEHDRDLTSFMCAAAAARDDVDQALDAYAAHRGGTAAAA